MFLLFSLLGALTPSAHAAVTCDDGAIYDTVQDAVSDPDCAVVVLGSGAHWESIQVRRSVTIVGAGRDETVLFCVGGPCVDIVAKDATVAMASMSVAGDDVAISSAGGSLDLFDFRLSPLGHRGGELRLRDTDTMLMNVEMEVVSFPAIDAVSRHGNDLDFERVRFNGVSPRSGARSVMYTSNYGVSCADCAFQPKRPEVVSQMLWGDLDDVGVDTGRSASHPYPQMFCPEANNASTAVCEAQCGGESVALCRMTYTSMSEDCMPRAVCVPDGEVPVHRALKLVRR